MRVPQQSEGARGSLRWIQEFVNERARHLDLAVSDASGSRVETPIQWVSPIKEDEYAEYRDGHFLQRLGISPSERALSSFWPKRGPQWDALGLAANGAVVLVEAKANIPEVITGGTGATGESLELIRGSLDETKSFLGVDAAKDWSGTFYQYTNRLAHLYLLRELNGIDAWLVNVYFVGDRDTGGPETSAEWKAALEVLKGAIGLRRHRMLNRVVDVYVEVEGSG